MVYTHGAVRYATLPSHACFPPIYLPQDILSALHGPIRSNRDQKTPISSHPQPGESQDSFALLFGAAKLPPGASLPPVYVALLHGDAATKTTKVYDGIPSPAGVRIRSRGEPVTRQPKWSALISIAPTTPRPVSLLVGTSSTPVSHPLWDPLCALPDEGYAILADKLAFPPTQRTGIRPRTSAGRPGAT